MGSPAQSPAPIRLLRELAQVRRILGNRGALRYLGCVLQRLSQVLDRRSRALVIEIYRNSMFQGLLDLEFRALEVPESSATRLTT